MPGFNSNNTFKIFIGKIPEKTTVQDIQPLFENYGKVVECDVVKNYGFVHMEDPSAGQEAIKNLNGCFVNGAAITVEEAKNKKRLSSSSTTKIFVGNISEEITAADIRALFSKFGTVIECDLVRNYAFVHIETNDLTSLLKDLNGFEIGGQQLKVQISTSRIRQRPNMGNPQQCYKCGFSGHWSKECTQSPPVIASNQLQYVSDGMHSISSRAGYQRDFYSQPPSSVTYMRERIIGAYTVPDMRDYYEQYCQNTMERYEDYAAMASRRDVYANNTRAPTTAEYEALTNRTNNSNIAHYPSDGRTYDQYNGAVSYAYANENCYGYGDYTATATGATAPAVDPYAANGRLYEEYNAALARSAYQEERRSDRRTTSRYAPY